MPNAFVYVALLIWPAVVFMLCRMLPPAQAVIASLVGGYLLLPYGVGFDFPLLPVLNKDSISALSVLVLLPLAGGAHYAVRARPTPSGDPGSEAWRRPSATRDRSDANSSQRPGAGAGARPGGLWIEWVLLALLLFSPALTVLQNAESFFYGQTFLRGLVAYDGFAMALASAMALLPYFLARRYLGGPDEQLLLLKGLVIAGVLYSFLALVEMRLSPQLSRWVYGYLMQGFDQAIRAGGYRPVVFLQHGLWLAIFFAMSVVAAFAVWKQVRVRNWLLAGIWLFVILVFSRSLGALAIALACLPVVLFAGPRSQVVFAGIVAIVVLLYPALRGANLIPVAQIAEMAESISADRAGSLTFRLENEDALLARANQKPLAGWGGWGRSRIFDVTGKDISITDGSWIITIGVSGWPGYIGQFGLLTVPILLLALGRHWRATRVVAGLCIVLCVNLVDMIPNATLTPITWLVAGALMGGLRRSRSMPPDSSATKEIMQHGLTSTRRTVGYSRG